MNLPLVFKLEKTVHDFFSLILTRPIILGLMEKLRKLQATESIVYGSKQIFKSISISSISLRANSLLKIDHFLT